MYYIYVLRSGVSGGIYVGLTDDLRNRYRLHSTGKVTSTKSGIPWTLVYYEAYREKADAVKRERSLKLHAKALAQLKRRLPNSLSSKGVG